MDEINFATLTEREREIYRAGVLRGLAAMQEAMELDGGDFIASRVSDAWGYLQDEGVFPPDEEES